MEKYADLPHPKVIVAYEDKIKGKDFELSHSHEEADTIIPNQVLAASSGTTLPEIHVWSPDTDVFLLLLDLLSNELIDEKISLIFRTGTGRHRRLVDINRCMLAVGKKKSRGLVALHNFYGADWGGKFCGKSKKTWIKAFIDLEEADPILDAFAGLGEQTLNSEKHADLFKLIELFICKVYLSNGPLTLPALRWHLFCTKCLQGELLPPTRGALWQHLLRSNYITIRDKSYRNLCPTLPDITENGWFVEDGLFIPKTTTELPAPKTVIELQKCGCKGVCDTKRCSCVKNGIPCTSLCKCFSTCCDNFKDGILEGDRDSEDEDLV